MTEDIGRILRERGPELRQRLSAAASSETDPEPESDADLLITALCADDPAPVLDRFAASAERLAEQGGHIEARIEGIERWCLEVSEALTALFAREPQLAAQALARLSALQGQVMLRIVSAFQVVRARQEAEEAEGARRGVSRLQALQRVNAAANSTLDLDRLLETTALSVATEIDADLCTLFLFDPVSRLLELRATNGPIAWNGSHFTQELGEGYTGWVAKEGRPLLVTDALADERFEGEAQAYGAAYRGLLSVPIISFTDEHEQLVGVISVMTRERHAFAEDEVHFLEIVAGQLAMSIENGRLYKETDEELRRKVHELSSLHRISALVASTLVFENVLKMIVAQAVQLSNADRSILFALDLNTRKLTAVANHGFDDPALESKEIALGECCAGKVVKTGEHIRRVDCMRNDTTCFLHGLQAAVGDQHSALCVPLLARQGPIGALCIFSNQRHDFNDYQVQLVRTFANVAAIAMENARLFEATREGLRTKEVLLREMHHRVKNNLQQVAAILNMQRRRTRSPEVEQILVESVDRIQGIAATHDLLSNTELGLARVDEIARKIVGIVRSNLVPPEMTLRFHIGAAPYRIPSEQATTLAIILNELIANAIEHGFEGRNKGDIRISGTRVNDHIIVRVADNGAGLPPGYTIRTSDGLGLQLVRGLAQSDLRGAFSIFQAQGSPDIGEMGERTTDPLVPAILSPDAPATSSESSTSSERRQVAHSDQSWTIAQLTFPIASMPEPLDLDKPALAAHED